MATLSRDRWGSNKGEERGYELMTRLSFLLMDGMMERTEEERKRKRNKWEGRNVPVIRGDQEGEETRRSTAR